MNMSKTTLALSLAMSVGVAHAQFAGGTPPTGTPPGGAGPGTTASASLLGASITIDYFYNDLSTALASSTVTAISGTEVSCPDSTQNLCASTNMLGYGLLDGESIDIGDTSISGQLLAAFTAESGDTFNGFVLSGLSVGSGYAVTGFTLSTNISGLDASDLSYADGALSINLLGIDPSLTTDGTGIGTYTITLQTTPVPEPSALAMLGLGLGMMQVMRRRRASAV